MESSCSGRYGRSGAGVSATGVASRPSLSTSLFHRSPASAPDQTYARRPASRAAPLRSPDAKRARASPEREKASFGSNFERPLVRLDREAELSPREEERRRERGWRATGTEAGRCGTRSPRAPSSRAPRPASGSGSPPGCPPRRRGGAPRRRPPRWRGRGPAPSSSGPARRCRHAARRAGRGRRRRSPCRRAPSSRRRPGATCPRTSRATGSRPAFRISSQRSNLTSARTSAEIPWS